MKIFQQQCGNVLLSSMLSNLYIKPKPQHPSAVSPPAWLAVIIGLLFASCILGQNELRIGGTVTAKDGRPIVGVMVYGSMSKTCCPFRREQTTTDKEGQFRLEHPGAVIHFSKDTFQPRAFVIETGASEIRITLEPSTTSLVVPICGEPGQGQKQVSWGKYGLRFIVPKRAVKLLGGKPDVDYVRYVVKPKGGEAFLELWFGPYAIGMDPDDHQFINSVNFEQRNVVDANAALSGMDSWGQFRSGAHWRQTAVAGLGGARYRNAQKEDVGLFNQIVNSICYVPYPSR